MSGHERACAITRGYNSCTCMAVRALRKLRENDAPYYRERVSLGQPAREWPCFLCGVVDPHVHGAGIVRDV